NDQKAILSADLHQFSFLSTYDVDQRSHSGTVGYRSGHVVMEHFAPVPHEFDAEFLATPRTFTVKQAVLRSGNSSLHLTATVTDYSNPKIDAQYAANLNSGEFRSILRNEALPTGVIRAGGTLAYVSETNRPFLESLRVDGNLSSNELLVQASKSRQ